jgi:DNA repair exonuclease SbcCD ATPase subunit
MRIHRLRLRNIRRHADLTLDLAPGLTVIRGPNEAGKSTVQRALEIALFRKPTSAAQDLDGIRRWGADDDPIIELSFAGEGSEGELAKRFAGAKGTVELRHDGQTLTDPAAVEEVVARLTGLPSERFFRATASIHHHELTGLDQDEATLRDRLQQSMSGADRGTRIARRKLEDAIRRYRSEGHKNPGQLKVARAEVERLEAALAEGEAGLAALEHDRQALADARERRVKLDDDLAQYRQALEASERALALVRRMDEASERYQLYKRAEELRVEIAALDAARPSPLSADELSRATEAARNQEFRLSEIRAEMAAEPDPSTWDATVQPPRWRPAAAGAIVLLLAGLAALAMGVVFGQLLIGGVVALVVLFAAVAAGLLALRNRRQARAAEQSMELHEIDVARRLHGRSDRSDQLREAERARDLALVPVGVASLAEAEDLLRRQLEHAARVEALRGELRGLLGERQPSEPYSALRDRAANEADECRHALAALREIGSEPEKVNDRLKAAVQRATQEREQALTAEAQAEARLESNAVDAEEVAACSEDLVGARDRLRSLERRLSVYETVLSTLDDAERTTMKKAARYLEEQMAQDIGEITDGRYRRLRVDESKLSFSVYSPESGDWVDARHLSQGTLDQLYLSARLGIIRQVTQPATPPLVLDDPFVTFDDDRARRALDLLRRVAADYQVILLTCSERYDALADKVIELPTPVLRDDLAEPPAEPAAAATEER